MFLGFKFVGVLSMHEFFYFLDEDSVVSVGFLSEEVDFFIEF